MKFADATAACVSERCGRGPSAVRGEGDKVGDNVGLRALGPLALILALGSGSLMAAGPSVVISTNHYAVLGTNYFQIRQSMLLSRPWKTSLSYDAFTRWDVKTQFTTKRHGTNWYLNNFEVKANVLVTLPSWVPGVPVSPELAEDWKKFYTALTRHEAGHVKLAREAAAEVHLRLSNLPPGFSDRNLHEAANRAVDEVMEGYRGRERSYDRQTRNGALDGARFPPRRSFNPTGPATPRAGPGSPPDTRVQKEGGLRAP